MSWVGEITQAVAYYRPFFTEGWRPFQRSARSHCFESRCDGMRLSAREQMGTAFETTLTLPFVNSDYKASEASFGVGPLPVKD